MPEVPVKSTPRPPALAPLPVFGGSYVDGQLVERTRDVVPGTELPPVPAAED